MKYITVFKKTAFTIGLVFCAVKYGVSQAPVNTTKLTLLSPAGGGTGEYIQNLRQTSSGPYGLYLGTNHTARLSILQNGYVGIGTTSPLGSLEVVGGIHADSLFGRHGILPFKIKAGAGMDFSINNAGTGYGFTWTEAGGNPGWLMKLNSNATPAGIPPVNPPPRLDVNGVVNANGFTVGGQSIRSSQWTTSGANIYYTGGNVGIGTGTPGFPLNFANTLGDKVSFWGNTGSHYGIGVQNRLLQIHTDANYSDIAFGYGNSTGFTEQMRIKGNGNVGIGTVTPTTKLDVKGKIKADTVDATIILMDGQPLAPGLRDEPTWTAASNGISYTGGNVGIGAASPGEKLFVNGDVLFKPATWANGSNHISLKLGDDNHKILAQYGGGLIFHDINAFTWRSLPDKTTMTLNKQGNLGIGTTKPDFPLSFSNALGDKVSFWGTTGPHYGIGIQNYLMQIHTGTPDAAIAFGHGSSSSFTEQMRIEGNGRVGIGTSIPRGTLDVIGSTYLDKGTVYIYGPNGKNFGGNTPNADVLSKYSLIVEEGVLSEDFAMAPVASWADYVFGKDYKLRSLEDLEAYIKQHRHLPNIPSQADVQANGYSMHQMNLRMMEKIEEIALYTIEQQKQNKAQQKEIEFLKEQLKKYELLSAEIEALKDRVKK